MIGIDLGGTAIKAAVVNPKGEILYETSAPTPANEGADAVIGALAEVADLCKQWALNHKIDPEGIGIGTPGIVTDDFTTVVGAAENISGWENINVAEPLEKLTGLKTRLTNDANAMALGEATYGAAKGLKDVLFVTVGTGVGGALLIDGKLWRGHGGRGMEVGHIAVNCEGEKCACGGNGCLEHYASTTALVRRYAELSGHKANGHIITSLFLEGDKNAVQSMKEHWRYLGAGIASLINIFSPQMVVIGGGISEAGDFYFEGLRKEVRNKVIAACAAETVIAPALLGNRAGCLGAASLFSSM